MATGAWRGAWIVALLLLGGCARDGSQAAPATHARAAETPAQAPRPANAPATRRDLSIDESMGGHTLQRHVGKSDDDLRDRLRREPQISSASTYTDRATAERVVGAALASGGNRLSTWQARRGRRPNLVLNYAGPAGDPIGRSMSRGRPTAAPSRRALIVLRWDERRDRFYVLTSYPEVDR